ncbi:MAG: immunoglobulin domain-containing protein [Verrucomicrobiales bacterium]|nr:immunoglobulin domain-containing protein [Verrucomicrobiales bacterium]
MRPLRLSSLLLSALLQCLPMVRVVSVQAMTGTSPILAILRFLSGATAVAGSFHAVSGASITLTNPSGGKVRTTNGIASPFRIELTYTEGNSILKPAIYDAVNLPPGFTQPAKSGSIWRIGGTPTRSGVYRNVRVTGYEHSNKIGHSATVVLEITVVDGLPVISSPPVGFTADAGTAGSLSVTATGGTLTYQWIKDDLELLNQTASTLTFASLSVTDSGTYRVRVQNSGGVVLSDPVVVTVVAANPPPEFTVSPTSVSVHEGEAFTLTSAATANGPVTYAWFKDTQPLGTTSSDFSVLSAASGDGGSYTVSATGAGGTTTSQPAIVTIAAPLSLGIPQAAADGIHLPFNGIPGRTYGLETREDLLTGTWTGAGEVIAGANPEFTVTESASGPHWYRVSAR